MTPALCVQVGHAANPGVLSSCAAQCMQMPGSTVRYGFRMRAEYLLGACPQLVESSAAVTWAFFAMPARDLDATVPIVDVRIP